MSSQPWLQTPGKTPASLLPHSFASLFCFLIILYSNFSAQPHPSALSHAPHVTTHALLGIRLPSVGLRGSRWSPDFSTAPSLKAVTSLFVHLYISTT